MVVFLELDMERAVVLLLLSELLLRPLNGQQVAQLELNAALNMDTADLRLSGWPSNSETVMESAMEFLSPLM